MKLKEEESDIINGKKGPTLQKIMKSVVEYGEIFNATHLAPIEFGAHVVMSFGLGIFTPLYEMHDEIIKAGLKVQKPFTLNPRPIDHQNVKSNFLQKLVYKIAFKKQSLLEEQYRYLGLKDDNAYTCTSFLPEVGNEPKFGQVVAASESMVVVYVNSVIGARTLRNAGAMDVLFGILGKVPVFSYLTDEGRKAKWLVKLELQTLPDAQMLGSLIGTHVIEDTFYLEGLDQFLGSELDENAKTYLKDMGALAATTGAMGLFHAENLTPEAKTLGKKLLETSHKTLIITDAMLNEYRDSLPHVWKNPNAKPKKAFIGCPHLTIPQLIDWTDRISNKVGEGKVALETVLFAAPDVVEKFKKEFQSQYQKLLNTGAKLSSICPNLYMANPVSQKIPIVTNSNKFRIYSTARYFPDEKLLYIVKTGDLKGAV